MRADVIERRAEDAETTLRRFAEVNLRLLGANEASAMEVEELKTWSAKVEKLDVEVAETKSTLKAIEEKIAKLEAWAEVAASKAIESFWALEEYRYEKVEFATDANDEKKNFV